MSILRFFDKKKWFEQRLVHRIEGFGGLLDQEFRPENRHWEGNKKRNRLLENRFLKIKI